MDDFISCGSQYIIHRCSLNVFSAEYSKISLIILIWELRCGQEVERKKEEREAGKLPGLH